ncbi:MAG TPA: glutathione transferase GstA [Rhodocyclaceae bacterium]
MKLYYSPGACSLSPHIVLAETGLPYTLERVDLKTRKTEAGIDFSTINSKGYVPVLRLDDGAFLTEGPAIVQYIADRAPDSGLAPAAGTLPRYRLQEWLSFIGTELHKTFSPLWHSQNDEIRQAASTALERRFDWLTPQLVKRPFLMGDRFTVADAYLFTVLNWTSFLKIPLDRWQALSAYLAQIAARPAVLRTLDEEGLRR